MKNLTTFINEAEKSKKQKEYQEFFDKKLKAFGVDSPAKLDDAEKKKFFDEIEKEWTGDKVNEKKVEEDFDSEDDKDSEDLKDKKDKKDAKVDKKDDKGDDEKEKIDESAMADLHIVAKEAKDYNAFKKEIKKDYPKWKDADIKELYDELMDTKESTSEEIYESLIVELSGADKKMLKTGDSGDVANIRNGIKNLFSDLSENGFDNEDISRVIAEIVDTSLQQIKSSY